MGNMTALAGWGNFYVIVGSSAGALIGLQFVVITLFADMPIAQGLAQASDVFSTPTIVHFGAVLFLSAGLSAPWRQIAPAAVFWGLLGLAGLVYEMIIAQGPASFLWGAFLSCKHVYLYSVALHTTNPKLVSKFRKFFRVHGQIMARTPLDRQPPRLIGRFQCVRSWSIETLEPVCRQRKFSTIGISWR
jgi:hypothetical protein